MTNLLEVGGLFQSTPPNLKDARTKAFMYACDRQIKKLLEQAEKAKVWCAIESVDEKYLDHMAADCRTLFYNSSLDPDVKRKLIANSYYWYMKLGTSAAVEEILNIVLQNSYTFIQEWFDYNGQPYRFKIKTNALLEKDSYEYFSDIIKKVKNERSQLDTIDLFRDISQDVYFGVANTSIYYPSIIQEAEQDKEV